MAALAAAAGSVVLVIAGAPSVIAPSWTGFGILVGGLASGLAAMLFYRFARGLPPRKIDFVMITIGVIGAVGGFDVLLGSMMRSSREGPAIAAMKGTLHHLRAAQERHSARAGYFATDVAQLDSFVVPPTINLRIERADSSGWSASTSALSRTRRTCRMSVVQGAADPPRPVCE